MKILIIGIVASGKTTLAKILEQKLNIKHYEIDSIVHDDINCKKRTPDEQEEIVNQINKQSDWIIEGTLRINLEILLDLADIIIYLDIPLRTRKIRILTRFIKQKLKIEKCNYEPTLEMLKHMYKWTNDYERNRDEREHKINQYAHKLIIIRNSNDWKEYIKNECSKTKKIQQFNKNRKITRGN